MNIGLAYRNSSFLGLGGNISNLFGIGGCPEDDANYVNTITADTNPDYDQWGPDCMWEGKHWVRLYNKKKEKYGKATADVQFAALWQKRSGFGHELTIANNDVEFRNMVVAEGLNKTVPDLAMIKGTSGALDAAATVAGSAADLVANASSAAANTAGAVSTITNWLPWIVLGAAILLGALIWKRQSLNLI